MMGHLPVVSSVLIRSFVGRVQRALLHGVRLRDAAAASPGELSRLADELESLVVEIRGAVAR